MIWKFRSRSQPLPTARLPDGLRVYAIGDVHGRADLLQTCSAALMQKVIRFQLIDRFTCFLATMWIAVRSRVTFRFVNLARKAVSVCLP